MPKLIDIQEAQVRQLIIETRGNKSAIAHALRICNTTLENYLNRHDDLKIEIAAARDARATRGYNFNPGLLEFKILCEKYDGNLTRISKHYGVSAKSINRWLKEHPQAQDHLNEARLIAAQRDTRIVVFEPPPEQVINVIKHLQGNVAAVAKQYQVSRSIMLEYISRHPDVQTTLYDASEEALDNVESSLYRRALDGEGWAVQFYLKTRGRKRGYIERGESFNLNVNLNSLSIEQLERLAAGEHPSVVLGSGSDQGGARGPKPYPATIEGTGRSRTQEETERGT